MQLGLAMLDPSGELPALRSSVELPASGNDVTAMLCCPICRRPFALDLCQQEPPAAPDGGRDEDQDRPRDGARRLRLRARNAHDKTARWVAAALADAPLPPCGGRSTAPVCCPHCRGAISLELLRGGAGEPCGLGAPSEDHEDRGGGRRACVTLLYGGSMEYFVGALVLGWSLAHPVREEAPGSKYSRVLLHTGDVPPEYLAVLSHLWELRPVDYLSGSRALYWDYEGSRFKGVFTKLHVLGLAEFDKVLMLDLDLLVRRNLDELFELRAPAALKKPSGRDQPAHGQHFDADGLWKWRRVESGEAALHGDVDGWRYDMCYGINAGVMLLHPDATAYRRMLAEIRDDGHLEHVRAYGPEQEYLGRFYSASGPGWTHMDARFNYQALLGGCANRFMRGLDAEQLVITHYSGKRVKPWAGMAARGGPLTAHGVRRLLGEDDESFARRFPENHQLAPTGGERRGDWGYPRLVVALVREWADALRGADRLMRERHGVELLAVLEVVEGRAQGGAVGRALSRCRLRLPASWLARALLAGVLLAAARYALRFRSARRLRSWLGH